jgi:hypothetical protein
MRVSTSQYKAGATTLHVLYLLGKEEITPEPVNSDKTPRVSALLFFASPRVNGLA